MAFRDVIVCYLYDALCSLLNFHTALNVSVSLYLYLLASLGIVLMVVFCLTGKGW